MKQIYLGGKNGSVIGNYAIVNDEDYQYLMQWKWHCVNNRSNTLYARNGCKDKQITMHALLLNPEKKKGVLVDHRDGNGLNNQRSNLRYANASQNSANRRSKKGAKSKYLGVSPKYWYGKLTWIVRCQKDGKYQTKIFYTEIEAALGYNKMAKELHGEYARLNIIEE